LEITKEELRDMYMNNTNVFVCKKLDITQPTLTKILKELSIPQKGKGRTLRKVFIRKAKD